MTSSNHSTTAPFTAMYATESPVRTSGAVLQSEDGLLDSDYMCTIGDGTESRDAVPTQLSATAEVR